MRLFRTFVKRRIISIDDLIVTLYQKAKLRCYVSHLNVLCLYELDTCREDHGFKVNLTYTYILGTCEETAASFMLVFPVGLV